MKISVVILTKNEEKNLRRVLTSVKHLADEIIILDDSSTDETVNIALDFGAEIIKNHNSKDFGESRNLAMDKAKNDWIFFIDADEEFVGEIGKIDETDLKRISAFRIKRIDFMWGREIEHGESGVWQKSRLIKKSSGKFIGKVHEEFETEMGIVADLGNCFLRHFPHQTISEYLSEINKYSDIRAKELFRQGKSSNVLEICIYPFAKFVMDYFLLLGFIDGARGFIIASLMSFYSFLVRSKLYILNRDNKTESSSQ
jgi:glycosyltransferase involved in cell wall biosynthesis